MKSPLCNLQTTCAKLATTKSFALNHDKSEQIYFFYVKHQAEKTTFLKDVESRVKHLF